MSDPLLTTLCGICRSTPPKYKCPRCGVRYCSVPCNRRHRARTGCNGIRDVTAYVPRERLRTAAGMDHDYNFMHGIEVSMSRRDKQVEEVGLIKERELKELRGETGGTNQKRNGPQRHAPPLLLKQWQGEDLTFVPTKSATESGPENKRLLYTCRQQGIELLSVPHGMARQRENTSVVRRRQTKGPQGAKGPRGIKGQPETKGESWKKDEPGPDASTALPDQIHWQIEWLVYEDGLDAKPTRALRRHLDHIPIHRAYTNTMAYILQSTTDSSDEDKLVQELEETTTTTRPVHFTTYSWQDPSTGAWAQRNTDAKRFFLLKPQVANAAAPTHRREKELIPIESGDTLLTALRGRSVLEFPTLYVLPDGFDGAFEDVGSSVGLPPGHVIGSTARREFSKRPGEDDSTEQNAKKRKTNTTANGEDGDDDDQVMGEAAAAAATNAVDESETSSEGSSDDSDDEEQDSDKESGDDGDDGDDEKAPEKIGETAAKGNANMLDIVESNPLEEKLVLPITSTPEKRRLVVYDSWSEGSEDEAA